MASTNGTPEFLSSELLAEVTPQAFRELIYCASNKRPLPSAAGSRIGTALHLIATNLHESQPFQLPAGTEKLSLRALQDLLKICKWPKKSAAAEAEDYAVFGHRILSPRGIYARLLGLLSSQRSTRHAGINNFLAANKIYLAFYENRFRELLDLLDPHNRNVDGVGQISLNSRCLKPQAQYVYPDDIRENLIAALKEHAMCVASVHQTGAPARTNSYHFTGLCLGTNGRNAKQLVKFDFLIAFKDFEFWQDFSLRVALPGTMSKTLSSAAGDDLGDLDCKCTITEPGEVCHILERRRKQKGSCKFRLELDNSCRLYKYQAPEALPYLKPCGQARTLAQLLARDLGQHDLTPKDKIILAFAVAQSFWEFYGSELTATRWSSEDIWFMHRFKEPHKTDSSGLTAFVSFPFGQQPLGPDEHLAIDDLTHSYPRILSLGIILLEIGCGKNLEIPPLTSNDNLGELRDSVNDAHSDAKSQLEEFVKEDWEMCKYKEAFNNAISNCLEPRKFIESPRTRALRSQVPPERYEKLSPEKKTAEDQKRTQYAKCVIQDRRDAIYENVVSPLFWLAKVGNDDGEDELILKPRKKRKHTKVWRDFTCSDDQENAKIQELWNRVQAPTFFTSGSVAENAERWFDDNRIIADFVRRQRLVLSRTKKEVKLPPIRIAILDTGCDMTLKWFQGNRCFKAWKDFAVEPPSTTEVDEYGHGTYMAWLVTQMVLDCELYIARIAQTTQDVERNEERIAEAIKYAGEEWEVDVISMSFGFPRFSQRISDAIQDVKNNRRDGIVFLASAGNDINRKEAYPARDASVISVFATESNGSFLNTNPFPEEGEGARRLLATYGDEVPIAVLGELRTTFPHGNFSAGTSIAAAVTAGIVGLVMSYAALLPHVLHGCDAEYVTNQLKTTDGMRRMLFLMARSWDDRRYFINPILFWSETSNYASMYRAICKAVP